MADTPRFLISDTNEKCQHYVLLSVSDKTGVIDLAHALDQAGYRIIATGGTGRALTEAGIPIAPISDFTGVEQLLGGRVKTLNPQISAGILYRRDHAADLRDQATYKFPAIDIVVCNLYPFAETIQKPGVTLPEAVEQIDIGGVTLLREAAKNFAYCLAVCDPADYAEITEWLRQGEVTYEKRLQLALKAFQHVRDYDQTIAEYFAAQAEKTTEIFPEKIGWNLERHITLRYGDNPHQEAALYLHHGNNGPLARLEWHGGRKPSATNVEDIDAGIRSVSLFTQPAAVIIKHNTPCGIALGDTAKEALARAIEADPLSAFGGVIVLNCSLDEDTAREIERFKREQGSGIDIVAATVIPEQSIGLLRETRKSTGIYSFGALPPGGFNDPLVRAVNGGLILQSPDADTFHDPKNWRVVTQKFPAEDLWPRLKIAWDFIRRIRSNSVIVVDRELPMTRGIGTGQTARVYAAEIALKLAGEHACGAILVSDGLFPFSDSIELAAQYQVATVIQPGGSVKDEAVIAAANQHNMVMIFTGVRAFWH